MLKREVIVTSHWTYERKRRLEDRLAIGATTLGLIAVVIWIVINMGSLLDYVLS